MTDHPFVVRRPRHEAIPGHGCSLTLEWIASARPLDVELVDLSRQGLKLHLDAKLPVDARLKLKIVQPANQFTLNVPVTVRWSRQDESGRWSAGCLFDQELSWEAMGELFLNGILCTDEIPHDQLADTF